MVKIILQPTGKYHVDAEKLKGNLIISQYNNLLDEAQFIKLNKLCKDSKASYWSNTSTPRNKSTWEHMNPKDIVLFANHGVIFASAIVTYKMRDKNIGSKLNHKDYNGNIYELFYFFDNVKKHEIPYEKFNRIAQYKPSYTIRNFVILSEEKSAKLMHAFNLNTNTCYQDLSEEEYIKAVREFDPNKPLDTKGKTLIRTEQSFLRKFLFADDIISTCGICGKEFPVELLVAAHIKKRAQCSNDEKLDYKNIVMPMCKLGCDALYEDGYITIIDGKIISYKFGYHTQALNDYIDSLSNRSCPYWKVNNSKYFKWHNKFVFRGSTK